MSPSKILTPFFSNNIVDFLSEFEKLSNMETFSPFSKRYLTKYFPIKPAPPVINIFIILLRKLSDIC